jgi:hypothetical protein
MREITLVFNSLLKPAAAQTLSSMHIFNSAQNVAFHVTFNLNSYTSLARTCFSHFCSEASTCQNARFTAALLYDKVLNHQTFGMSLFLPV